MWMFLLKYPKGQPQANLAAVPLRILMFNLPASGKREREMKQAVLLPKSTVRRFDR